MEKENVNGENSTLGESEKDKVASVGKPTMDEIISHVHKLSLNADDIIVIYEMKDLHPLDMRKLKKQLMDNGIRNFVLVLSHDNFVISKLSYQDFIRMLKVEMENRKNEHLAWLEFGLLPLSAVKYLMNEASIQRNKTAETIIADWRIVVKDNPSWWAEYCAGKEKENESTGVKFGINIHRGNKKSE